MQQAGCGTMPKSTLSRLGVDDYYAERKTGGIPLGALPEDQNLWLGIEAKWIMLAHNAEHVERTSNFLASSLSLGRGPHRSRGATKHNHGATVEAPATYFCMP